jgi:hypothetical protein
LTIIEVMGATGKQGGILIKSGELEQSKGLKCGNDLDFSDNLLTPPSTGSTGYITLTAALLINNYALSLILRW